jgi:hypothetical protein
LHRPVPDLRAACQVQNVQHDPEQSHKIFGLCIPVTMILRAGANDGSCLPAEYETRIVQAQWVERSSRPCCFKSPQQLPHHTEHCSLEQISGNHYLGGEGDYGQIRLDYCYFGLLSIIDQSASQRPRSFANLDDLSSSLLITSQNRPRASVRFHKIHFQLRSHNLE